MTLKELITLLQQYPPETTVELNNPDGTANYPYIGFEYTQGARVLEICGHYFEEKS
jgi:hypothetical protein